MFRSINAHFTTLSQHFSLLRYRCSAEDQVQGPQFTPGGGREADRVFFKRKTPFWLNTTETRTQRLLNFSIQVVHPSPERAVHL